MTKTYQGARLQETTVRGYKSIAYDKPVTLKLGDVSILLGANDIGKSNIISFFRILSYMMNKSFGRYAEISGTSHALLHYGIKRAPVMPGKLKFADSNPMDAYDFSLASATSNRLIITEERITWHRKGEKKPYEIVLEPNSKESVLAEYEDLVAKTISQTLPYCKVYQFHDPSAEGPLRQACPAKTANYPQSYGNNLPSFLLSLRENYRDTYNRIVDYARGIVPQFQDSYPEPVDGIISLRWIGNSATDYRFNACQLSDGSIRSITLAASPLQPTRTMPNVITSDEPEFGLHPYVVSQLAEMIKDTSMHAQVIIAAQSKGLVDRLDIGNISVVEINKETQAISVTHLDAKEYHLWLQNYMVSELWDKNIIGGRPV